MLTASLAPREVSTTRQSFAQSVSTVLRLPLSSPWLKHATQLLASTRMRKAPPHAKLAQMVSSVTSSRLQSVSHKKRVLRTGVKMAKRPHAKTARTTSLMALTLLVTAWTVPEATIAP